MIRAETPSTEATLGSSLKRSFTTILSNTTKIIYILIICGVVFLIYSSYSDLRSGTAQMRVLGDNNLYNKNNKNNKNENHNNQGIVFQVVPHLESSKINVEIDQVLLSDSDKNNDMNDYQLRGSSNTRRRRRRQSSFTSHNFGPLPEGKRKSSCFAAGPNSLGCQPLQILSKLERWSYNNRTFRNISSNCVKEILAKTIYYSCAYGNRVVCCNIKHGIHDAIANTDKCEGRPEDPTDEYYSAIFYFPYKKMYKKLCDRNKNCTGC